MRSGEPMRRTENVAATRFQDLTHTTQMSFDIVGVKVFEHLIRNDDVIAGRAFEPFEMHTIRDTPREIRYTVIHVFATAFTGYFRGFTAEALPRQKRDQLAFARANLINREWRRTNCRLPLFMIFMITDNSGLGFARKAVKPLKFTIQTRVAAVKRFPAILERGGEKVLS